MVQGHMPNATTHVGTNSNPSNYEQVRFPLKVGLVGPPKAKVMAAGGNGGSGGGNQAPHMPTWNHHANMGMGMYMGMGGAPTIMTPQMMQPMIQRSVLMQ